MFKRSLIVRALHKIFSILPEKILCLSGTCKDSCGEMSKEDDLANIKSTKLRAHLSFCKKCWNYSKQMKIMNDKIVGELKTELESKMSYTAEGKKRSFTEQEKSIEKLAAKFSAEP